SAICYRDWNTDQSVQIGTVRDSIGTVDSNQVVYSDAFSDLGADVRYTTKKSGMSQDVIFRAQLPSPAAFNLNPQTVDIEIWTEFLDPPIPMKRERTDKSTGRKFDLVLEFGDVRIAQGFAFPAGKRGKDHRTSVAKEWVVLDGR